MEQLNNNSEQHSNDSLQQSKKISEALVKTFETYFAVTENIEDYCMTLNYLTSKIRDYYEEEKQTLKNYKRSLAAWKISPVAISNHTTIIQAVLKELAKAFDNIYKEMKDDARFFKSIRLSFVQEDRKTYSKKIYESYTAFKDIFLAMQDIAFAQEALTRKS